METVGQVLGLIASVLGILAFFGFARYADVHNLFEKQRPAQPVAATAADRQPAAARRAIGKGLIAGAIGALISIHLTLLVLYYEDVWPPKSYDVAKVALDIAIAASIVALGWKLHHPMVAAVSGLFVGALWTVIDNLMVQRDPPPGATEMMIVMGWIGTVISGALGGVTLILIGAAGTMAFGALIGAAGGFIAGLALLITFSLAALSHGWETIPPEYFLVTLLYLPLISCLEGGIIGAILQGRRR